MFSGSVARGARQPASQMNDHRCAEGNRRAKQNSAYDLLPPALKQKRPDLSIRPFFLSFS